MKHRCAWSETDPLYNLYHDTEWGVPVHNDRKLFEMLNLEGAQAGLSWITILRKRENYRKAFDNFDPKKIVKYNVKKISSLMKNEARVGLIEELLVEGPSKRDPLITSARTKQNKLVHFAYTDEFGTQRPLPAGTFVDARITSAAPHFLRAQFLAVTARPRHRVRIPVAAL